MPENQYGQFHRIEQMIGREALDVLHQTRLLVAGLGAVGSYAVEALARCGIGSFTLIDCDTVKPSNINRQLFALWETVGRKKTDVARERVRAINPDATVETFDVLLNEATLPEYLRFPEGDGPVFLIDAIDSLGPKVDLIEMALRRQIPFISSMGAALRTDPTLVRIGPLTEVTYCPLSAAIRKRLRRRGVNTDEVRCAYSPEEVRATHRDKILPPECSEDDRSLPGRQRCTLGSLPTITGIFGLFIANEVIRVLTEPHLSHTRK